MADGKGCKCAAYSESDCACDADWTPQELIDARSEIERLRLTDAERQAVKLAIDSMSGVEDISASWSQRGMAAIATLRGLLDRTKPEWTEDGGK